MIGPFRVGHKLHSGRVDSVWEDKPEDEWSHLVCEITRWFSEEEAAAIAHLFAAAPNCLELCKKIRGACIRLASMAPERRAEEFGRMWSMWLNDELRDVIQKAQP